MILAVCLGALSILCSAVVYSVLSKNEQDINFGINMRLNDVALATLLFSIALTILVASGILYGLNSSAYLYSYIFLISVEVLELCGLLYTLRNLVTFGLDRNFTDFILYMAVIYLLVDKAVSEIPITENFMLFSYVLLMSTAGAVMAITVLSVYIMWQSKTLSTLIDLVNLVKPLKIVCFAYATLGMGILFTKSGFTLVISLASIILLLATAQTMVELYEKYVIPCKKVRDTF